MLTMLALAGVTQAKPLAPPRGPDLDGDGYEDLVVGVPQQEVGALTTAGAVHVLYGSDDGPHVADDGRVVTLTQDMDDSAWFAQQGAAFGLVLAWGNFDGDCYDDLAVAAPYADAWGRTGAGGVQIFYGGPDGPGSGGRNAWIDRMVPELDDRPEDDEFFGRGLAAGDFDGDGIDDLAIGAPYDDALGGLDGTSPDSGSVTVLFGGPGGLEAFATAKPSFGTGNLAPHSLYMGSVLAAGDINCDGQDELFAGVPYDDLGHAWPSIAPPQHVANAGAVWTLSYQAGILPYTDWSANVIDQDLTGGQEKREEWDYFGTALAVGNFDQDTEDGVSCQDLAVGAHLEDVDGLENTGRVHVFYGAPTDIHFHQTWHSILLNQKGNRAAAFDHFGEALVVGDLSDAGLPDLGVGIPRRDGQAGGIEVFRSSGGHFGSFLAIDQDSPNVDDSAEAGDYFGTALGYVGDASDADDGFLAVGVPDENLDGVVAAGAVNVLRFDLTQVAPAPDQGPLWRQDDIDGTIERADRFGASFPPTREVPPTCPPPE